MYQHIKQISCERAADIARAYSNGYNAAFNTRVITIEEMIDSHRERREMCIRFIGALNKGYDERYEDGKAKD